MSKAGRTTAFFASLLTAASIIQPTTVVAENNYKDYDITPFSLSEKELTELEFEDTNITFFIPSSWEEDEEYDCYYPGKEDEIISFYYFDSVDTKKFDPKQDIDDVVDYFLNEEYDNSSLSSVYTDYYKVGDQYIAKTSFTVTFKDDGETFKWKEINYIIPVNKKYIMNINVVLDSGIKQNYAKEEEALILTIKDNNKKLFENYIASHTPQSQTAAIGTVTRHAGTTTIVSTPTPAPQPQVPVHTYVLNTNTMKFHLPNCSSISKMKASNRWDVQMTRDEVIAMGYVPCKKCYP